MPALCASAISLWRWTWILADGAVLRLLALQEQFGTGTAAQSEAGKKGGERAKEMGAGIM
jgi:hypothetical protein